MPRLSSQAADPQGRFTLTMRALLGHEAPSELVDIAAVACGSLQEDVSTDMAFLAVFNPAERPASVYGAQGEIAVGVDVVASLRHAGLGIAVIESGRTIAAENYLEDRSFRHDDRLDASIRRCEITSLAATPVFVRGEPSGALYLASFGRRVFTRRETRILEEYAELVGPALTVESTHRTLRTSQAILSEAVQHLRSEARESQAVITGMAEALALMASGARPAELLAHLGAALTADAEVLRHSATIPAANSVYFPIGATCGPPAVLVVTRERPLTEQEHTLCRSVAHALEALRHAQQGVTACSSARVLMDDVIHNRDLSGFVARAHQVGAHALADGGLAVAMQSAGEQKITHAYRNVISGVRRAWGIARVKGSEIVALVPADPDSTAARKFLDDVTSEVGPVYAGMSDATDSVVAFPLAVQRARRLSAAARALELGTGRLIQADSLGLLGMHIGGADVDPRTLIDHELGELVRYDDERGSQLLKTIEAYFQSNFHVGRTARALTLHPKTVSQRLQRITSVLGPGWGEMPRALNVGTAIRLHLVYRAEGASEIEQRESLTRTR